LTGDIASRFVKGRTSGVQSRDTSPVGRSPAAGETERSDRGSPGPNPDQPRRTPGDLALGRPLSVARRCARPWKVTLRTCPAGKAECPDVSEPTWRPWGLDRAEDATSYDALHDGVPRWMEASFWEWIEARFTRYVRSEDGVTYPIPRARFDNGLLRQAERLLRLPVGINALTPGKGLQAIRTTVEVSGFPALRLADYLLSAQAETEQHPIAAELDQVLHQSGSAWRVGTRYGRIGLVRRVPEGVQLNADEVMRTSGQAGSRLVQAWDRAFGLEPDPSAAYDLAVRAVEDAAIPVVVPRQADASLGHVIGQLRTDGDWALPLVREEPTARTESIVLRLCQALWRGHRDRHGGGSTSYSGPVTQEEAETAVTIAVPLVQWFASGMVQRRNP
jgi:hypothetical protein